MNKILEKQIKITLAKVLSEFKDKNGTYEFLEDFLTPKEFETLAKRLAVAYWLKKGRSNENIKENLNVPDKTILQIKKSKEGPGFQKGLKLLEADEWANVWATKIKKVIK